VPEPVAPTAFVSRSGGTEARSQPAVLFTEKLYLTKE